MEPAVYHDAECGFTTSHEPTLCTYHVSSCELTKHSFQSLHATKQSVSLSSIISYMRR